MKTRDDVIALMGNWESDPCWDIETTEGFEEYYDELLAFSREMEEEWRIKAQQRLVSYAKKIGCSDNPELAAYIERLEQKVFELEETMWRIRSE